MSHLPGWNSLPTVSRLHDIFEVAGIVFLGLLVLAEILAYQYGHRRDELLATQEKATQQASDVKMALLHKRADAAQAEAMKAQNDLATSRQDALLAEKAGVSRTAYTELVKRSQQHSPGADVAARRAQQIQGELSAYESPLPYAVSLFKTGSSS